MKVFAWLIFLASIGAVAYALARWRKRWEERQRMAEARFTEFMTQMRPPTPAVATPAPQERLLLEAAAKAGEAGEPALAIQLYAKLLARFPQSSFAEQARAAVAEQKKRIAST